MRRNTVKILAIAVFNIASHLVIQAQTYFSSQFISGAYYYDAGSSISPGFSLILSARLEKLKFSTGIGYVEYKGTNRKSPTVALQFWESLKHKITYIQYPVLIQIGVNTARKWDWSFLCGGVFKKAVTFDIYRDLGTYTEKADRKDVSLYDDRSVFIKVGTDLTYKIQDDFFIHASPCLDYNVASYFKYPNKAVKYTLYPEKASVNLNIGIEYGIGHN